MSLHSEYIYLLRYVCSPLKISKAALCLSLFVLLSSSVSPLPSANKQHVMSVANAQLLSILTFICSMHRRAGLLQSEWLILSSEQEASLPASQLLLHLEGRNLRTLLFGFVCLSVLLTFKHTFPSGWQKNLSLCALGIFVVLISKHIQFF